MAPHIEVISRGLLQINDHFLLCVSQKGGYAYLPGGHLEFGESARAALEREFLEETGLRTRAGDLLAVSEASFRQKQKSRHEVNLVFHVELLRDRRRSALPKIQSLEESIAFTWATPTQIGSIDVRPASAKSLLRKRSTSKRRCIFDSDFVGT